MRTLQIAFYLLALLCLSKLTLMMMLIYLIYLLIEDVLFLMTFKTWRLPEWVSYPITMTLNWLFEIILQCCRGLVGKPLK